MVKSLGMIAAAAVALVGAPRVAGASSSCIPGFNYAAFGTNCVAVVGNSNTDSYNSSVGPYSTSNCTTLGTTCIGNIGTDSTATSAVAACGGSSAGVTVAGSSGDIKGSVNYGNGGTSSDVSNSGTITGTSSALNPNVTLTPITFPTGISNDATHGPGTTWSIGAATTLPTNTRYGTINSTKSLTLNAGTYIFDKLTLSGSGVQLIVATGPVVVYLTGDSSTSLTGTTCTTSSSNCLTGPQFSISGSGSGVNNSTSVPSNFAVFCGQDVTSASIASAGTTGYMAMYCPNAAITLSGNSTIFGALVGASTDVSGGGGGGGTIHYDAALANFTGGGLSCTPVEQSRATPIIATYTSALCGTGASCPAITQGSFVLPSGSSTAITTNAASGTGSVASFSFPYITGHMRANESDGTYLSTATTFANGHTLFDAATSGNIPAASAGGCTAPYKGSCRGLFTNAGATYTPGSGLGTTTPASGTTTFHPVLVNWQSSGTTTALDIGHAIVPLGTFSPDLTTAQYQAIAAAIAGGATPKLGGVDRSTVAVIGPSTIAGISTRPQVVYFGGLDGMLHAVCGQAGGTTGSGTICPGLGTELWAFAPRVQLPLMKSNKQRIDGSVRVLDVFGDFTTAAGTGTKSWHTILNFQTGFARDASVSQTPAMYAIDVTDPSNPSLIWEYIPPGTGLALAAGRAFVNSGLTDMVLAETNNGTGTTGVVATAINQETGATVWSTAFSYPYPTTHPSWRTGATNTSFPSNGIPGGAVAVDLTGNGFITDFVMADLYGDLWRLAASTGSSQTGTNTPLFSFTTDQHPLGSLPTIYAKTQGGPQYAVVVSGGYDDPTGSTSWSSTTQYVIGVKLAPSGASYPLTEASSTTNVPINATLTSGDKSFSQAIVIGTTLLLTSDSTDVNSSTYGTGTAAGHVTSIDLTATSTTVVTPAVSGVFGGSSLGASGTSAYLSSGTTQQKLGTAGTTGGAKVDISELAKLTRGLWLRTQ